MVFMLSHAVLTCDRLVRKLGQGFRQRVVGSLLLLLALGPTWGAAQTPSIEKTEPKILSHTGPAAALVFSADGRRLASVYGVLKLWDVATGQSLRSFELPQSCPPAAFSADARLLVTGRCEKDLPLADTLKLWEVQTGRELGILASASQLTSQAVAFSGDGRLAASASQFGWVAIFDVQTRRELRQLIHKVGSWLETVAFSPDGYWLASAGEDELVKLLWVPGGRQGPTLTGHSGRIMAVAFSPDASRLASGSADDTVKLWDLQNGNELRTLAGHKDRVTAVAFSADGRWLASGSSDTMKLWDVETGRELLAFERDAGGFAPLTFSPDGRWLAAGTQDAILLWQVATGRKPPAAPAKTSQPRSEPADKPPRLKRKR